MTGTSPAAGLNCNIRRTSDPVGSECMDDAEGTAAISNAFDRMLVELAGEITPHEDRLHTKVLAEATAPAGKIESARTGLTLIQEQIWRDNQQYDSLNISVKDGEPAFNAEESVAEKSNDEEIPVLSDLISIPVPVAFRPASAVSAVPNDATVQKISPLVLDETFDPEIIHQDTITNSGDIDFATIETHLPPLINHAAREIEAGSNDIVTAGGREPDKTMAKTAIKILKINLHPVELGGLAVRIRMSGATMQVEILAESRETVSLLSHLRERLLQNLTEAGVDPARAELTIGFASLSPPNESSATADRSPQDRYSGDEHRGGFSQQQSDHKREEMSRDAHSSEDQDIRFGDMFPDRLFI
jgi:hypothetical protein